MRIVFLGSPEYAVYPLKYLVESSTHEVLAVVSQTPKKKGRGQKVVDSPVAFYAKEKGIKVFTPEKASNKDFLEELSKLQPDVCLTCAYGKILTQKFLDLPKRGTINIHPSKLPLYRGAVPVPAALLDGLTQTAVTVLFTVKALDAGHIIVQDDFAIDPKEKASDLLTRLFKASCSSLEKALQKLEDPSFKGDVQREEDVTHCTKISKEDGLISWEDKASFIFNRFRAFYPWPGSYTFINGKRLVVEEMDLGKKNFEGDKNLSQLGQFYFCREQKSLRVKTGESILDLIKVKPEGKKAIGAQDFWNQIPKDKRDFICFDKGSQKV